MAQRRQESVKLYKKIKYAWKGGLYDVQDDVWKGGREVKQTRGRVETGTCIASPSGPRTKLAERFQYTSL